MKDRTRMFKTLGLLAVCMTALAVVLDWRLPDQHTPTPESIQQHVRQAVDAIDPAQAHRTTVTLLPAWSDPAEQRLLAATHSDDGPVLRLQPNGTVGLTTAPVTDPPSPCHRIEILLSSDSATPRVTRPQAESLVILLPALGRALTDRGIGPIAEMNDAFNRDVPHFARFLRGLLLDAGFQVR